MQSQKPRHFFGQVVLVVSHGNNSMSNKIRTGKDTVVIGNVSGDVGDGSVVIGATDERGNTIINQPMAVGKGASAGPGSIAIGAGASANH